MYKTYHKKFLEPSINSWVFNSRKEIISPIKNQVINIDDINWYDIEDKSQSEILWLYSLGALVKAHLEDKNIDISHQLNSFYEFQLSSKNDNLYNPKINHSYDHCLAVRIRYLCILLSIDNDYYDIIQKILRFDLSWFSTVDDLPQNNHGMMVCIAIFHLFLFVKSEQEEKLQKKASNILIGILNNVIPQNYYVAENTIGYHEFYVKTLRSVLLFLEEYNIEPELIDFMKNLVSNIEKVLYQVVYPSGGLPPIGQCGAYQTKYKSLPGCYIFNPQGFWVNKDDSNYMSFISGHASKVHKQIDDLSVSLRLDDQDIFLDCGLGTYDHRDNKAVVINGQRGHSGPFFKAFDKFTMWEYYSSKKLENSIARLETTENIYDVVGYKKFEFNGFDYNIVRNLIFNSFKDFIIIDEFFTTDSELNAKPVSRFILSTNIVSIQSLDAHQLLVSYPNHKVVLSIQEKFIFNVIPSYDYNSELSSAYYSSAYGKYHNIFTLEIIPLEKKLTIKVVIE